MESDEDPFALSDDEVTQTNCSRNPVEEHLLKQRHDVLERVEKAKCNVQGMRDMSAKILKKLNARATCGLGGSEKVERNSSDSDTESDLYQVTGEPVVKKKRLRSSTGAPLLIVQDVWQKVVDTKWIVGVVLENASNRTLENPCLYVFVKDEREHRGVTSFWKVIGEFMWTRTEELDADSERQVATVVLDLPSFENHEFCEAFGTLAYVLDGKHMQTAVPTFRLGATEVIDKSRLPRFNDDAENSVLAIKAVSVERTLAISLEGDAGRGARLIEFLENRGFKEILTDVWVSRSQEHFRHYVIEIHLSTESEAIIRISARSPSQLSIIVHMLREEFPDMNGPDSDTRLMEAAIALERELELELARGDAGGIQMARVRTDLLIP